MTRIHGAVALSIASIGCLVAILHTEAQGQPSKARNSARILRVASFEPGELLVTVSIEGQGLATMPLRDDVARVHLRDGRRVDVSRFAIQVAPRIAAGSVSQPFNTTVVLTSAKEGARLGRTDTAIADLTPISRPNTVYLCGSHFTDTSLYLEMFFQVSASDMPRDVSRVEVMGLSATPPLDSIVTGLWQVPNNQVVVENATATDVIAKLKGPTAAGAAIRAGASELLPALEGDYYVDYQIRGDRSQYFRQTLRRLVGTQSREVVRITADSSTRKSISEAEFNRLATCPPAAVSL